MIRNLLLGTWNFIAAICGSIVEGRKLRSEMTLRMHGVKFDNNGNVIITR